MSEGRVLEEQRLFIIGSIFARALSNFGVGHKAHYGRTVQLAFTSLSEQAHLGQIRKKAS